MAAVDAGSRNLFSGFKWYQFGECLGQKEVIKNTVVLKKDANIFTCFGKSLIFQLLPFVFDSRHGSTESFTWVVSPLNARSDREAK